VASPWTLPANLYIADGNNCIRKVSNGVITTVAGNGTRGFSGDNGPPTNAQLADPTGVAVDSAGNLYIADLGNSRIRKVSNGVITTVGGKRDAGLQRRQRPATAAQLNGPIGVAVDSAGNVYIGDYANYRIRKVSNEVITTVAGNGVRGYSYDNGPATSAQLYGPNGVAVDSAGNLYVNDGTSRIRKVSNGVITTVAGNRGAARLRRRQRPGYQRWVAQPGGIAVDSAGGLYIADAATTLFARSPTG